MYPFRQLDVWRKAHELSLHIYRISQGIDWRVYAGLASQMQRAALSIPLNIAEGSGRASSPQFAHFLQIAIGSAHELDYQLLLARDLGTLEPADHAQLQARVSEVNRMLVGLRRKVMENAP
jgi:four helix bundle protein